MEDLITRNRPLARQNNVRLVVADGTTERATFFFEGVRYTEGLLCDIFQGHAAALIKAGVITEAMLPGRPGNKKTVSRIASKNLDDPTDGDICVRKAGPRTFSVRIGISANKRAQRSAAAERQRNENTSLKSNVINDVRAFRNDVKTFAKYYFEAIEHEMFDAGERYKDQHPELRYTADARGELIGHLNSVWSELSRLIDYGTVVRTGGAARPELSIVKSYGPRP